MDQLDPSVEIGKLEKLLWKRRDSWNKNKKKKKKENARLCGEVVRRREECVRSLVAHVRCGGDACGGVHAAAEAPTFRPLRERDATEGAEPGRDLPLRVQPAEKGEGRAPAWRYASVYTCA